MTLKELSQLYYLNREIEMDKRRLEELEAKLLPGSPVLSEMPRGAAMTDKTSLYISDIVELQGMIAVKQKRCICEQARLEQYINKISDSLVRQIFVYRFVNGLPWEQVAACIGGSSTGDSVKKICYRHIKNG